MTLDELLLEWSYRSERGYPSTDNPSDVSTLKQILKELKLSEIEIEDVLGNLPKDEPGGDDITNPGTDGMEDSSVEKEKEDQVKPEPKPKSDPKPTPTQNTEYDDLILKTLGVDQIPLSKNKYKYPGPGGATFTEQVQADDLEIWQKLWESAPDKKTEKGVATAGVGKGEVSLYWLYTYSDSGVKVDEGREGDDPDLFFNGNGMEVKAYGSHNAKLSIGRYGTDKENLRLLSTIFGIGTLARVFGGEGTDKTINPTNFAGKDLEDAFESVSAFGNVDLDQLSELYPIFSQIKNNLDFVDSKLEYNSPKEGGLAMGRKFLKDKLGRKPGDGNHLVNVKKDGSMKFFLVDFNAIDSDDDILNKMSSSQSAMNLNFTKVFG